MDRSSVSERYRVEREIGRGGMATVHLARDLKHDRPVALKVLRPEVAADLGLERFLREIRLAAQLHHPHILPVYDSGTLDAGPGPTGPYYVMPFIEGESLRSRLDREGRLPVADALLIAREVAEALDYAHRRHILHRDIKPENILLEEGHALVADFGIARAIGAAGEAQLTGAGLAVGTPAYMSPEQVVGRTDLDGRTDVYSLACVLFEMLAGEPPFSGGNVATILTQRLIEDPPRLATLRPGIPAAVEEAVNRGLAREPAERAETAGAYARLLASAVTADVRPTAPRVGQESSDRSIAVLPFVNLSPDPENEYFSDGMTEEIISALSQVPGLRVTARSSAFALKGKSLDARAIGKRLKVRSLLEGSVRKVGDRIRISTQLIDAVEGYQVWSQVFDRTLADVFAVQDELARAIAGALTQRVTGSSSGPLVAPQTTDLEAYTLYLRGNWFVNQRSVDGMRTAIDYFEQAIDRDQSYALAHAGLANCWAMRGFDEYGDLPPREAMPRAKAAVRQALQLDPLLAGAHRWQGVVTMLYDWDWAAAEAAFRRALELGPDDPMSLMWYATFLGAMGRHDQGLSLIRRAEALDPISLLIHLAVARSLAFAGRFDEAAGQLRATIEMDPRHGLCYNWLSRALCSMRRYDEGAEAAEQGMRLAGPAPALVMMAGYAYGMQGREGDARRMLQALEEEGRRGYLSPLYEALVRMALGELDEVFRLYDVGVEQRSGWLPFFRVTPQPEHPSRADPRFAALLKKVGLDF